MILVQLGTFFALCSFLMFGGVSSVVPELQRFLVEEHGWISATDFMRLFALAQAAPGPNVLIASLLGWRVAGVAGSLVCLVAICLPAGVLAWWIAQLWERFRDSPWREAIKRALTPLVVGLTAAGGYIIATPGGTPDWRLWAIALGSTAVMLLSKINPLWTLAAAGAAGGLLL